MIGIILIGFGLLAIFIFVYILLDMRKLNKLRREYNAEEDKSRRGDEILTTEIDTRGNGRNNQTTTGSVVDDGGLTESQRRELLSSADVDNVGEDSESKRKTSRSVRGIFKKLKKNEN